MDSMSTCLGCRDFVKACYKAKKFSEVKAGLDAKPDMRPKYLEGVQAYELKQEDVGKAGRVSKYMMNDIAVPEIMTVTEATSLQGEMALGVFWPEKIYKEHFNKPIPKGQRKSYLWNGKTLWGITLPDSSGNPTGTIKVSNVSSTTVARVREVESSGKATRAGQVADSFRAVRGALGASSVQEKDVKDGGDTVKLVATKRKSLQRADSNCSSGDDWIRAVNSSIAGHSSSSLPADSETETEAPATTKKKKKTTPARSMPSSSPKPKRKAAGASTGTGQKPAKMAKVFPSVQQREISATQGVLSEGTLCISTASSQEGLKSLAESKVRLVINKMQKKTEAKVVRVLTYRQADFDGDAGDDMDDGQAVQNHLGDKGEQLFNDLQAAIAKLEAIADLLQSMETKQAQDFGGSPSQLHYGIEKCTRSGVSLPPYVQIVLVHRQFDAVCDESGDIVGFLTTTTEKPEWQDYFGLWLLHSIDIISRQQEVLINKYLEQVGQSATSASTSALQGFVASLSEHRDDIADHQELSYRRLIR